MYDNVFSKILPHFSLLFFVFKNFVYFLRLKCFHHYKFQFTWHKQTGSTLCCDSCIFDVTEWSILPCNTSLTYVAVKTAHAQTCDQAAHWFKVCTVAVLFITRRQLSTLLQLVSKELKSDFVFHISITTNSSLTVSVAATSQLSFSCSADLAEGLIDLLLAGVSFRLCRHAQCLISLSVWDM